MEANWEVMDLYLSMAVLSGARERSVDGGPNLLETPGPGRGVEAMIECEVHSGFEV